MNDRKREQRAEAASPFVLAASISIALHAGIALADSRDGVFPTAEQVGGEVFPKGLSIGDPVPPDIEMYDEAGKRVTLGQAIQGRRTVIAFFISGVPVSVQEVIKLQSFMADAKSDRSLVLVNADTVGVALLGGPTREVSETVRTVKVLKREHRLVSPVYVAPNDALSPNGLSNRLGFRGLPTVFLVDERGRLEKSYVGPQQWKPGDI